MTIGDFDGHTMSVCGRAPLVGANCTFSAAQTGLAGTMTENRTSAIL
jgi:hypothetical protein